MTDVYTVGQEWESLVQRPVTQAELYLIGMAWGRYPEDVVAQAVRKAFLAVPERKRLKVKLSWLAGDVSDALAAWQRAVGPNYD